MRSFIKSHRRSQSTGSSDISIEELPHVSSPSNQTFSSPPSQVKPRNLAFEQPGSPSTLPKPRSSAFHSPTASHFNIQNRSTSDSKALPILSEKGRSSMSSPRLSGSVFSPATSSNVFSSASSALLSSSSSSSLKKLNPITFIKRRRASNEGPTEFFIPSAEDYKEAGSIYGTRTHDWGSSSSTASPVFHPTPVFSSPAPNGRGPNLAASSVGGSNYTTDLTFGKGTEVDNDAGSATSEEVKSSGMVSSELSLVREDDEEVGEVGLGLYEGSTNGVLLGTEASQPGDSQQGNLLDLADLQKELSTIIRKSRVLEDESADDLHVELLPAPLFSQTDGLIVDKRSSITTIEGDRATMEEAGSDEDDHHSEFSFEEDSRIGRNSSVNYHKPLNGTSSANPRYQLDDSSALQCSVTGDFIDSEDENEYLDEYNCDYDDEDELESVDHIFGTTSYHNTTGLPYLQPNLPFPMNPPSPGLNQNVSITQVSPLRVSTHFSDGSEVEYKEEPYDLEAEEEEEEDDVKSYHTAAQSLRQLQDWNDGKSMLSRYEDTFDGDIEDGIYDDDEYNYDSMLDEVNAVPSDDDEYDDDMLLHHSGSGHRNYIGLRKAKSYAFEGYKLKQHHVLKRQTSVIKVSNNTTVTLFAGSPSLSKKSSTSSSVSVGDLSSSMSSLSSEHLTLAEAAELTYGSFLKDPPKLSSMGRGASLTPISERSYDSDYSVTKHDSYDVI